MTDRSAISRRAAAVSPSATLAITAKANRLRAEGRPVIGYGAGEPDFPTPAHVVAAAREAAADPRNHRYSPAAGLPELREAIAVATRRHGGLDVAPSQVVVTNGGKQAVYLAFQALVDPGDEVLVPAPYWVTYPESVRLAGGVPVPVPSDESTGFTVDPARLDAAVSERTKVLVFVSPSNPTGAVYPPDLVAEVGSWAAERGIWVLCDEIYDHLVYGDATFSSLPVVAPEAAERCVVVNGVAKTYAMTGWRVGWLVAPSEVAAAATRLQSHISSNVANVSQRAALAAITGPAEPVERMRQAFDRRRRTMVEMLRAVPGVTCAEPQGAFYAFPNLEGLLGRDLRGHRAATTLELADLLLDLIEIAIVPGEAFGSPGYARLSFALGDGELAEGLNRLRVLASA